MIRGIIIIIAPGIKIPKLENRRKTHLLNLVYPRAHNQLYIDTMIVPLRRYDAPILLVYFPNNETFRRSIVYQGAIAWNALSVEERAIETHVKF